ncbi:MAG: methyltransferase domain-containing protein [Acidimicrobiales bacterium]
MNFNKACTLEDFEDPGLVAVMREVCAYKDPGLPGFPKGSEHRKDWEVAMAVRTFRELGALRPDATLLGVAAGMEDTVFYLTRHCRQVFSTDRYLSPGEWGPTAPVSMLIDPTGMAPADFDASRLVCQHMDARLLRYPDEFFDGVFSSSSIEHVGGMDDVANAAYEMGRVLKPGGILSLSTEIRLSGPPDGIGWPGSTLVFPPEHLRRYIIEASGLEPVDDLDLHVSDETRAGWHSLTEVLADRAAPPEPGGEPVPDYARWEFPHIVLHHLEHEFTSVHLALRKPHGPPPTANRWAAPTARTVASVRQWDHQLLAAANPLAAAPAPPAAAPPSPAQSGAETPAAGEPSATASPSPAVADVIARLGGHRGAADRIARRLRRLAQVQGALAEIGRLQAEARAHLESLRAREAAARARGASAHRLAGPGGAVGAGERLHWTSVTLAPRDGVTATMVVDPHLGDPRAAGLPLDEAVVEAALDLVAPGRALVDVDAGTGQLSLPVAAAGGRVTAVVAVAAHAALLRASAARNGFTALRVVEAATGRDPSTAAAGPPAAATVALDELLVELRVGDIDLVRVDAGGAALETLQGMAGLLSRPDAPPVLVVADAAALAARDATPAEVLGLLEDAGYTAHLMAPQRLVAVQAADPQPQTAASYLAFRSPPPGLARWEVEPSLTSAEWVSRAVADCAVPDARHRAHMATALAGAGADVLAHASVVAALERLRADPDDQVRAAAAWSASGGGPTEPSEERP